MDAVPLLVLLYHIIFFRHFLAYLSGKKDSLFVASAIFYRKMRYNEMPLSPHLPQQIAFNPQLNWSDFFFYFAAKRETKRHI